MSSCDQNLFCEPINGNPRFITNYTPNRTFNQYIRFKNGIHNSTEFRQFLQKNGGQIINNLNKTAICSGKCHNHFNLNKPESYLDNIGFLKYKANHEYRPTWRDFYSNYNHL